MAKKNKKQLFKTIEEALNETVPTVKQKLKLAVVVSTKMDYTLLLTPNEIREIDKASKEDYAKFSKIYRDIVEKHLLKDMLHSDQKYHVVFSGEKDMQFRIIDAQIKLENINYGNQ